MKASPQIVLLALIASSWLAGRAPEVRWRVEGEGRGTPAADDATVFFLSKRHEVVAVDRRDGRVRWRQSTGEQAESTEGFAVTLAGGVVVAGDYNVVAFDRATGSPRWKFVPREGYAPGAYLGEASGRTIVTGSPSGRVFAIDAEYGVERWSTPIAADGKTLVLAPAVEGTAVIAGFSELTAPNRGGVAAIDLPSGRIRWKRSFPTPADPALSTNFAGGPVFWQGQVIVSSGDGNIHGFGLDDGELRWSIPRVATLPGELIQSDRDYRALVVARGILVSGSVTGYVVAYDLDTRRQRWRIGGPALGSISLRLSADDVAVYVPTLSGALLALDLDAGEELWRRGDFLEGFMWAPRLHGDLVLAAASRAGFFAFPREIRP